MSLTNSTKLSAVTDKHRSQYTGNLCSVTHSHQNVTQRYVLTVLSRWKPEGRRRRHSHYAGKCSDFLGAALPPLQARQHYENNRIRRAEENVRNKNELVNCEKWRRWINLQQWSDAIWCISDVYIYMSLRLFWKISELLVGRQLPGNIYIYI